MVARVDIDQDTAAAVEIDWAFAVTSAAKASEGNALAGKATVQLKVACRSNGNKRSNGECGSRGDHFEDESRSW